MPHIDATEAQEIDAAFDKIDAQRGTIRRLRAALETIIEAAAIGDAPHVIVIAKRALKQ